MGKWWPGRLAVCLSGGRVGRPAGTNSTQAQTARMDKCTRKHVETRPCDGSSMSVFNERWLATMSQPHRAALSPCVHSKRSHHTIAGLTPR